MTIEQMLNLLFSQTPLTYLTQSLWRDEAFSYFLAKKNVLEIILLSAKDFTPPLYHIILHFWLKLFGSSEISLRGLSLLFFWATLYICFLFLSEIFKLNLKKSFFYLLFFLLNPFLVYYAFEARPYTLLAFLATSSFYFFYKRNYSLYFLLTLAGLYTHYFMLFVILGQLFFNYLINKRGKRFDALNKIIIKPILLFLPWLIFILFQKNFFAASFWIQRVSITSLLNLLGTLYTGFDGGYRPYAQRITLISLALLLVLIALSKIRKKAGNKDRYLHLYLGIWGIGIPIFVILISLVKPVFFPRYFIFSTVGFLLLLILLLDQTRPVARTLVIILLFVIALDYQKIQIRNYKKRGFSKVAAEVRALASKDDPVYVTSELDFFTVKYYLPEKSVYIFNKTYKEIPDFVGKALIFPNDIASSLPSYPKKAFVIKPNGTYNIQALY